MASLVGQTVSHYRILEQIGRGGMGLVYKAEDLTLGRTVAVKFLPPEITPDSASRKRFVREAQAASSLDHPNICTIHEIGEAPDGQIFIVMGYYEGETLKQKIEHGPLNVNESLQIVTQVSSGLAKAHERGIVHRDIKPANVIVTNDGDARILDFGVASLSGTTSLTMTGHTVGTVAYMAPEQAQGSPVDARSDLFSLGALLYEMTTGRRPFAGEHDAAVMYSILHVDPPLPSSVNNEIPPAVDALILRLLEKNPARRYQMAREVRSDLMGLTGQSGPGDSVALPTTSDRMRRVAGYAAVIVAVAVIGWLVFPHLFPGAAKKTPWRIAVLPFQPITRQPVPAEWPLVVQMMMVDHLNGVEELRVIDPFTFSSIAGGGAGSIVNALASARQVDAALLVNGTIESVETSYVLRCRLTDVADGSVELTASEAFLSDRDLPQAVQLISRQILSYFQIQTFSGGRGVKEELGPWLNHRTKNMEAIKAFLQGAQLMRRWQPGGSAYFKKAIELDSTFVTPRTWLIAGLVSRGKLEEARPHQSYLMRHMFEGGPFEQALIRWTGAMIEGDVAGQIRALEGALEYSPRDNVLLYLLASLRASQDDYAGAVQAIRPAVESGWSFQPASLLLGRYLFRLRSFSESRTVLEHSLTFEPVLPETYALLTALASRDGDGSAADGYARELLRRAQTEHAATDSLFALLGETCAFAGAHAQAAAYYSRAIDLNLGNASFRLGLASSALETGDITLAHTAAKAALEIDPSALTGHDLMGRISEAGRDTAAAMRYYMTYLAHDSTSVRSREIRNRMHQLIRK